MLKPVERIEDDESLALAMAAVASAMADASRLNKCIRDRAGLYEDYGPVLGKRGQKSY